MADQGSGHFIGIEGLRRGFLAIDQQIPTRLLKVAQAHWNLASIGELIEFANSNPAPDFSKLAPLVVKCAEQGDQVAREVLQQGGADLAYLAGLVIERIRGMEADFPGTFEIPPVAIAGSILEHVAPVRQALEDALRKQYPAIVVLEAPADPPVGALWGARHRSTRAADPVPAL
jgi:N-acetylglucosamine kinase-like BadF-type ATPase